MEENLRKIKEIIFDELDNDHYKRNIVGAFGWYRIKLKSGIKLHCYKGIIYKVKIKKIFGSFHWYDNKQDEISDLELRISDIVRYNIYPEVKDFRDIGILGRIRNFYKTKKNNRLTKHLESLK